MVQLLTSEGLISDIPALLPLGAKQSKVFECDSYTVPTAWELGAMIVFLTGLLSLLKKKVGTSPSHKLGVQ